MATQLVKYYKLIINCSENVCILCVQRFKQFDDKSRLYYPWTYVNLYSCSIKFILDVKKQKKTQ
jgi:hypothetical protein